MQGFSQADALFGFQFGFDLYRTSDGIEWSAMTHTGYGDPLEYGVRSFASTPAGLFFGSAHKRSFSVFHRPDVQPVPLVERPHGLRAESEFVVGRNVNLSWQPVAGAIRYRIYRSTVLPISQLLGSGVTLTIGDQEVTVTLDAIRAGELDHLCTGVAAEVPLCQSLDRIKASASAADMLGFPLPFILVGISANPAYFESAPTSLQSIYFVRAEDSLGNLSKPSNIVGGPSKAAPGGGLNTPPPIVSAILSPEPNASGWYSADQVNVSWSVSTPRAGVKAATGCDPVSITAEGSTAITCEVTNSSGQTTSETVVVQIDRTAPTISFSQTPAPNDNGWNNTTVQVSVSCLDGTGSGVTECGPTPQAASIAGSGQAVTASAIDAAGNVATVSAVVNIDMVAPEFAVRFDPASRDIVVLGRDNLSGVAGGAILPVAGGWRLIDCGELDDEHERRGGHRGHKRDARTYVATDLAGNTVKLQLAVRREGHQLRAQAVSIAYNNAAAIPLVPNLFKVEWATARDGTLRKLEQNLAVGKGRTRLAVKAEYDARSNTTVVKGLGGYPPIKNIRPGLFLLQTHTDRGTLARSAD
jgi:hypothetical protein